MIGVTIQCRLGNQLFQYACARSIAKTAKTSFFLNVNFAELIAAKYFRLDGYSFFKNKFYYYVFKIKNGSIFKTLGAIEADGFDHFDDNNIYNGYFQSEKYFLEIKSSIGKYIVVRNKYKVQFEKLYSNVFQDHKTIAVHIRRGDYLDLSDWWNEHLGSNDLTLPQTYYRSCLHMIPDLYNYKIFFISDDISYVRTHFSDIKNSYFSDNGLIIDFQILLNADVCIISHSSFAWWGAYLNPRIDKHVYCPKYWLGYKIRSEYPKDIIPKLWTQVDVDRTDEIFQKA